MTGAAAGAPHLTLGELSPSSRVWLFGASRPLEAEQERVLEASLREFLSSWKAHGRPLRAAVEIRDRRFVIVAADDAADPSGCSIDALFARLSGFQKPGLSLLDSTLVFYRTKEGEVRSVDRATFRRMVHEGEISGLTKVFDLTAQTLGDVRSSLEKNASESWHAQAFGLS